MEEKQYCFRATPEFRAFIKATNVKGLSGESSNRYYWNVNKECKTFTCTEEQGSVPGGRELVSWNWFYDYIVLGKPMEPKVIETYPMY